MITLVVASLITGCIFCTKSNTEPQYTEPFKVHITCYIDEGTCASGEHTRRGIAAMKKEWIGKTAIVYLREEDGTIGDVYGIYELEDCGGTEGLKSGNVIDIWEPDMDEATRVMAETKGLGYVQLIDAEG